MDAILKHIHCLGKQDLQIRGKSNERSNLSVFLNAQTEPDPIIREHMKWANQRASLESRLEGRIFLSNSSRGN